MNLRFMGDALDHWKASLFGLLREGHALQDLAIDPMATDLDRWKAPDYETYARILRLSVSQVIEHHASLVNRIAYFGEILHTGDLFLDPDIGIATGRRVRERRCYVLPSEVGSLLDVSPGRVLVIYQHIRAQRVVDRVDKVLTALKSSIGEFGWCSYESSGVALLFFSRNGFRSTLVADCFDNLLGAHTADRIRSSTSPIRVTTGCGL